MSKARRSRSLRTSVCDVGGLIPPGELFGRVLPVPRFIDADQPFDERVERAWSYIKAAHFAAEEHGRLREVLGAVIAGEVRCRGVAAALLGEVQGQP
jgi:hypothetical protein